MSDDKPEKVPGTFLGVVASLSWALNVGLLIGLVAWIWFDHRFMEPFQWFPGFVKPGSPTDLPMTMERWFALKVLVVVAGVSFVGILAGLVFGAARHRRLRAWLALTALVAGWLALAVTWPELKWTSQAWRMGGRKPELERIARPLRNDWPRDDGALVEIGPFSAYPIGDSRTLMLLTQKQAWSERGWGVSTIERSPNGGLRMKLTEDELGSWVEWHPKGERPESFVGGLAETNTLERSRALGGGWFLVRY